MYKFLIAIAVCLSMTTTALANDQSQIYKGKIETIESRSVQDSPTSIMKASIKVLNGDRKGEVIEVNQETLVSEVSLNYKKWDKVLITQSKDLEGNDIFYITDYYRADSLIFLFILFIVVVYFVAGKHGIRAVLSMAFSFLIISKVTLPLIINGYDPVFISTISALILIPTIFYISHGFSKKAHLAIVGVLISIVITSLLMKLFVDTTYITGLASDDAFFLQFFNEKTFDVRSLYIAGVIISLSGILDDATISQVSIVQELRKSNKKLKGYNLYQRAMSVGKDHISSMVNTLVLVYAGSSLPLLLIFINTQYPLVQLINLEVITQEVVRTLVGSIGLILAIPITTYIAARYYDLRLKK